MKTLTVTCDGCEKEIKGRPGYRDDHLVLSSAGSPTERSNFSYSVVQHPKVDREYHFHDFVCLIDWHTRCFGDATGLSARK